MSKHIITYSSSLDNFRTKARSLAGTRKEVFVDDDDNLILNIPSTPTHYNTVGNVTHSISLLAFDDSEENIEFLESLGLEILAIGDTRDETNAHPYKTIFRAPTKKAKYDLAYPIQQDENGNDIPRHAFGVFDL